DQKPKTITEVRRTGINPKRASLSHLLTEVVLTGSHLRLSENLNSNCITTVCPGFGQIPRGSIMLRSMGTLNFDRYHAAMGDASYKDVTRVHGKPLSEMSATFYVTQRKLPFAPVLGHERLIRLLVD